MTDEELLEAAAKAAGVELAPTGFAWDHATAEMVEWNPLRDDGQALRLAVALDLLFDLETSRLHSEELADGKSPDVAARRAIVRAAAAMAA